MIYVLIEVNYNMKTEMVCDMNNSKKKMLVQLEKQPSTQTCRVLTLTVVVVLLYLCFLLMVIFINIIFYVICFASQYAINSKL